MAFRIGKTRHGNLVLRGDLDKEQFWEGTGLKDTPENRQALEKKCLVINYEIAHGTFDYERWFPQGNRSKPAPAAIDKPVDGSLKAFYLDWIEDKKPPLVRKSLARDYRQHFNAYIVPELGTVAPVESLSYKQLVKFRSSLIEDLELSVKTCRNIIDGSMRAMYRSVWADNPPAKNPFEALEWPDRLVPPPDPFTEEQRDLILEKYRATQPRLYPWVYFMFWTGMRPSEAAALTLGDVDLYTGKFNVWRSRNLGEENSTKTGKSKRTNDLLPNVIDVLKAMPTRLHASEKDYLFTNTKGGPIDPNEFRKRYWYGVLAALKIRPRKPYCMRHTFISVMLSVGTRAKFIAEYVGTSLQMIEEDYGKFIRNDGLSPMLERLQTAAKKARRRRP
jgi:integrase